MVLLVKYKCEQTINPSIYISRAQVYQAYEEINRELHQTGDRRDSARL